MITIEIFGLNKENNTLTVEDVVITNGSLEELKYSGLLENKKYLVNAANKDDIIIRLYISGKNYNEVVKNVRIFLDSV